MLLQCRSKALLPCKICGRMIKPKESMFWDTADGKPVCQKCKTEEDLNCRTELVGWDDLSPEEQAELEAAANEPEFDPDEEEKKLEKDIEATRLEWKKREIELNDMLISGKISRETFRELDEQYMEEVAVKEAEWEIRRDDIEFGRFVKTIPMGTDEDLKEMGILPDDNLVYMPFDRVTDKDKKIMAKRDRGIEHND